jgi:hypothetical protein
MISCRVAFLALLGPLWCRLGGVQAEEEGWAAWRFDADGSKAYLEIEEGANVADVSHPC